MEGGFYVKTTFNVYHTHIIVMGVLNTKMSLTKAWSDVVVSFDESKKSDTSYKSFLFLYYQYSRAIRKRK